MPGVLAYVLAALGIPGLTVGGSALRGVDVLDSPLVGLAAIIFLILVVISLAKRILKLAIWSILGAAAFVLVYPEAASFLGRF